MSVPGGWSEVKQVTLEVIKICLEVRPMVKKMVGTDFMIYIPVVYRSQVVEGENYLVKHTTVMTELGGWSEVKPVTLEVIKICLEVRPKIEKMVGTEFKIYIPVVYRSQVVEGINYMVKVLVDVDGDGVCVHALIFQALPCYGGELSVTKTQYPKPFEVPLIPF